MKSGAVPGAPGTIKWTGRAGYGATSLACVVRAATASTAVASVMIRRFIWSLLLGIAMRSTICLPLAYAKGL